MNFDAFKRELLAHYVEMADQPAFKSYVWARVQEMAKAFPSLWGDLPELLTKTMKERAE